MTWTADCPYCDYVAEGMTRTIVKQNRIDHLYDEHQPPISWHEDVPEIEE